MHFPQIWQSRCQHPHQSLGSCGGGGTGEPSSEQAAHQESRCAEMLLHHELSWMQISMTNTTARAHTEGCRRKLENCLAEDEKTKFRSEAAKLRVEGWLTSRVESTDKSRRGDTVSHAPSGAASSSAPAAAASSSASAVASSSSAAAERFRSDEVPTSELDVSEVEHR